MSRKLGLGAKLGMGGALAAAALLAGCGKQGVLEQPAPLFGARAKAEYEARRQEAADEAQRAAQRPPVSSSAPRDSSGDNAPRTTRDVLDPGQRLTPASRNPIPGAPNPFGAPVQAAPNN